MNKVIRNIILGFLLAFLIIPNVKVNAASKYVSKKTITTTVDYSEEEGYNKKICIKSKNKNAVTKVSVKIVKMKGKAKYDPRTSQAEIKKIVLFGMSCDGGYGAMAYVSKKKFKTGAKIKLGEFLGSGYFELDKPYGVESVTYKFTFKTKKNKKTLKSVSIQDLY